jgi:DNA-binding transcriptional regulator YiaG
MTVSEAIKKIRWELRLSQQALAEEIKCTQTSVSAWELGQRNPGYKALKKLDEFAKKNSVSVTFL